MSANEKPYRVTKPKSVLGMLCGEYSVTAWDVEIMKGTYVTCYQAAQMANEAYNLGIIEGSRVCFREKSK